MESTELFNEAGAMVSVVSRRGIYGALWWNPVSNSVGTRSMEYVRILFVAAGVSKLVTHYAGDMPGVKRWTSSWLVRCDKDGHWEALRLKEDGISWPCG